MVFKEGSHMKPTRQIRETIAPVVRADEAKKDGYLSRKFAWIQRNYAKCWEDAHIENAERDAPVNKISSLRKVSK